MSDRARLVATGLPAGAISNVESVELSEGWSLTSSPPGAFERPSDLSGTVDWCNAVVPGTVAAAVGPDDLDAHPDYDDSDWWYRCEVPRLDAAAGGTVRLRFDGLATLAEVWFNDEPVLESTNMFCAYEVDVTDLVLDANELVIVFRSLGAALDERRPRPRWKTKLVEQQQLRWFRTTLLGRIPGWTPPIRPVGPWRSVWIESAGPVHLKSLDLRSDYQDGVGTVSVEALISCFDASSIDAASLLVNGHGAGLSVDSNEEGCFVRGEARMQDATPWWPKTHGEPALHDCVLRLNTSDGVLEIDLGRVGFRKLHVDQSDGRIQFVINDVPAFCRGSCWSNNDIVSLAGSPERMKEVLKLAAEGNANMIRVGGTMIYESDEFYRICDELGLMVWQDFMFANMDYPVDDPDFASSIAEEAQQQLQRLARHPSVVAFCGGSELEQQAAMFGVPREIWTNEFFSEKLLEFVRDAASSVGYWPSTPTGGALPFDVGEGLAHYYGVGAYRRPLDDVRLAGVRFTPECLGFSNVPDPEQHQLLGHRSVLPSHPAWKSGVPRDSGTGWDFEDVRDHYLEQLYSVDAIGLRTEDVGAYLAVSRTVTGEIMERTFAEWRSDDVCWGALTWFLNDLRPGAGWGIIDSGGRPKPTYYFVRRAWTPRRVFLLDRGLDGLDISIINECGLGLTGSIRVLLVAGTTIVADEHRPVSTDAWSTDRIGLTEMFGYFIDATYSYRFGPLRHDAVVAMLLDGDGAVISEDVYRPVWSRVPTASDVEWEVSEAGDEDFVVTLSSTTMLYGVDLRLKSHVPQDRFFILVPGQPKRVHVTADTPSEHGLRGVVEAVNLQAPVRISSRTASSRA